MDEFLKDTVYPQVNYWVDHFSQQEHATSTERKSDD
jgi:hypothetical protein